MLRFQTSVALWDRSSVSAGSVTVSLYRLQCLVEFSQALLLLLHVILLRLLFKCKGFFNCFVYKKKLFCSHRHHHLHGHQNKLCRRTDGWETDWMLLSLELVFLSWGKILFLLFSQYKKRLL